MATDEKRAPLDTTAITPPRRLADENQPIYFKGYTQEEIASLLDDRTYGYPDIDNQAHVDNLVDEYGRALYDRHLEAYPNERQITVEQARAEVASGFAEFVEWQRAFESDPGRQGAVSERARHRGTTRRWGCPVATDTG